MATTRKSRVSGRSKTSPRKPGPTLTARTFRITNVRANATGLTTSSTAQVPVNVQESAPEAPAKDPTKVTGPTKAR